MNINRRGLMSGCSAWGFLAVVPRQVGATSALTHEAFLKLSEKLTGQSDLDAGLASRYLAAFEANGDTDALKALVANGNGTGNNAGLADDIVAAWYTGVVAGDTGNRFVTYKDALIWNTLTFTNPLGFCGGEMGYWAKPPAT